jgi:hypothetical protein
MEGRKEGRKEGKKEGRSRNIKEGGSRKEKRKESQERSRKEGSKAKAGRKEGRKNGRSRRVFCFLTCGRERLQDVVGVLDDDSDHQPPARFEKYNTPRDGTVALRWW